AIVEEEEPNLPAQTQFVILADQSKDIRSVVNDLENNIIAGLILVVLVLYFFMGTRNGFLVGIAIPLSMLLSFIVISSMGYTLNMIVLFSLILALGMLVDNAIVIVENIYRHHEEGKGLLKAASDATSEVGMAVIASTVTTLLAFL
ncbi:MAG: AcrB/AcrD/AcrF family protein, partial [Aliifodinibius sp.]|nr:efflux RND transporter permease subunit [Fodinibius sp.]NIV13871.1 AcrB/AcrD/AcrF family protein [Fodinibius sp.]NIY24093.1 AcrB/AcrD/AcrF family protein [Fodinibius sp.]